MDDVDIISRVHSLIEEEHQLRDRMEAGSISGEEEQERLRSVEESLDQCWDLLRQRRARRDAGQNPDDAKQRPVAEVEGYLQ